MSIPASSDPVRLALIGAGRWGRNIIKACSALDGYLRLVSIASGNPETAALAPPGCAVFADWRSMLEAGGLDGVVIASPPALHAPMALAAIACRVPVLVEKPLTLDPESAQAVARAAQAAGVPVMVDHIHLYNSAFRKLLDLAPTLGPVREVRGHAGNRGPYRADSSPLWDWGAHDLAMIGSLLGLDPPTFAVRRLRREVVGGVHAENLELTLGYGRDVTATCVVGTLMERRRDFRVRCDGGTLLYDDLAPAKLTLDGVAVPHGAETPLGCVLREFAAVVAGTAPVDGGLALGLEVVRLLARAEADLAAQSSRRP